MRRAMGAPRMLWLPLQGGIEDSELRRFAQGLASEFVALGQALVG